MGKYLSATRLASEGWLLPVSSLIELVAILSVSKRQLINWRTWGGGACAVNFWESDKIMTGRPHAPRAVNFLPDYTACSSGSTVSPLR